MANRRVTVEKLPEAFRKIVEDYENGILLDAEDVVRRSASKGVSALKASSAARVSNRYAQRWAYTIDPTTKRLNPTAVIYAKSPGLPHLIEHGHALLNGGRTPANPHIAPVAEEINRSFVSLMEFRLGGKI